MASRSATRDVTAHVRADAATEQIIQRLEKLLSMPGTAAEKQLFITEVLLPEVLIWWLQTNSNMCRYRAELMLLKSTSAKEEKSAEEMITGDTDHRRADWCHQTQFEGHSKCLLSFPWMKRRKRNF
ncbi:hypothetical protein INR49_029880 [Caranx melampygus]|nr:hypothetical protein INR49_029880 [Caranx melampygus]